MARKKRVVLHGQWIVKTPVGMLYGPFKAVSMAETWGNKEMAGGNWYLMQLHPPTLTAKPEKDKPVSIVGQKPFPKSCNGIPIKNGRVMTGGRGVPYFLGILRAKEREEENLLNRRGWRYRWSKVRGGYVFS